MTGCSRRNDSAHEHQTGRRRRLARAHWARARREWKCRIFSSKASEETVSRTQGPLYGKHRRLLRRIADIRLDMSAASCCTRQQAGSAHTEPRPPSCHQARAPELGQRLA